ncbi:MAG: SUMF1/EgtB/PvdO family nonheme iron enzyme [Polyangiaceae bacterium]|nr:SUMF1/EgtB/PvdO family nonheme iron enzyme [Polyangiaceae bacterium]
MRSVTIVGLVSSAVVLAQGCSQGSPPPAPEAATASSAKTAAPVAQVAPKKHHHHKRRQGRPGPQAAVIKKPKPDTAPAAEPACPEDMALVSGDYCRAVEERCLEYAQDEKHGPDKNRCLKFEKPTRCVSKSPEPRQMRYCMDRYEYPNKEGELPMTLVSWSDAQRLCQAQDKRLCTESEFTFACEGEEMRPYAIGFERDATKCNIDKPYLTPKQHMLPQPRCQANASCAAEMKRIDGRRPIGENKECVSPFGIYDLNGNANEWVSEPWKQPPHRAAIKGGWWGPVRNRCRAITTAHDETYLGYEVGFRCCKDATPE